MTREEIQAAIRAAATAKGVDPTHALTMASIESRFNPGAVNGQYKGLYQFGPREWATHGGGGDIFDPNAQIAAFHSYHPQIQAALKQSLGREPTPQELYLGWQQGAGGAHSLINKPTQLASETVAPGAITGNGGTAAQTAADFVAQQGSTYDQHQAQVTSQPVTVQPQSGLLQGGDADLAGYNNPTGNAPQPSGFDSREGKADDKLAASSALLTKGGLDMYNAASTKAPEFGGPAPQAHLPEGSPVAMPNYTRPAGQPDFMQMMMQQRLQRRR